MSEKTMFMETTRIAPERTVSEIQHVLMSHGANAILMEYEAMAIAAVSFKFAVDGKEIPFRLPCRWREVETMLRKSGKRPRCDDTYEKWARRVAWRIVFRWVEAQMAFVESRMVKVQEVFFPYIQTPTGKTLYEITEQRGFALEYKPTEAP